MIVIVDITTMTSNKNSRKGGRESNSNFPIPSSLQDLEREPHNLLPYPVDFADDDEAQRAESFDSLVQLIERGNQELMADQGGLPEDGDEDAVDGEPSTSPSTWMDEDRLQAIYTLVR